jgi:hypothetical protein
LNYLSQSITTIDSSPATSAHEAGEYFIFYDGAHLYRLAKASSNIAVGDTLTPNGNFIYSSVANMIADLKVEIADLKSAIGSDMLNVIDTTKYISGNSAVVYNNDGTIPEYPENPGGNTGDNTETEYTAYFDNSKSNWSNVYAYAWDNSNNSNQLLGTWPGTPISVDSESGYYKVTASIQATTPMIIFNNGSGTQTADLSWVNNGVYTASGYAGLFDEYQGGNNEGDDTEKTENTWIFYYNDTNWGSSTVYAYVWDAGNGNKTYLGSWPGTTMSKNNEGMWEMSFTTTDNLVTPMVIFNNGQGGGSNQTADLALKNNGIYNYNGWEASRVEGLVNNSFHIGVYNGEIVIKSDVDTTVSIIRADGLSTIIEINNGINYISNMPRGFYIVKGENFTQKVILK